MTRRTPVFQRTFSQMLLCVAIICCAAGSHAQANGYERTFPQSKAAIEKILNEMQSATAGRLPVLDGFATSISADHPLDRYRRGYYQSKFQVTAAPSGGSVVRVSVQVTAWYADPVASKSGYQLLTSNGRLEADLLDQLADQLAANAPHATPSPSPSAPVTAAAKQPKSPASPTTSQRSPRPSPDFRKSAVVIHRPWPRVCRRRKSRFASRTKKPEDKDGGPLQTEVDSLEEILKNQAHPKNLVAVKKSGTPVVASASLTAKTLFLASAHDEFEMLDFNRDWVHVRISGLVPRLDLAQ